MKAYPKAVVVFAGARDHYQLPLALAEEDLLETFVTDMYWPADKKWFQSSLGTLLSSAMIDSRFCAGIASTKVLLSKPALGAFALMKLHPKLCSNRTKDKALGRKARATALKKKAALFSTSYYASEAFQGFPGYRFLFQVHPHPQAVRRILSEEMKRTPLAHASLTVEHELSLLSKDFHNLCNECHLANGWVVASSYTAQTLAEAGVAANQIHVVPYGIDHIVFAQRACFPNTKEKFTLIFVGSLVQRKGLSYLLDSVRLLKSRHIRVILCGRGFVDKNLLTSYNDLPIEVHLGLPQAQLIRLLQESDVFVFPSLVEGFAHVILEAMSCGLPVITTPNTCGPDVMVDGAHGFIIPIRDPEAIAEKLAWGMDHRAELAAMGEAAASQARLFTWERFRAGIRASYQQMITAGGGKDIERSSY